MDAKKLADVLSISPQIAVGDVPSIKAAGFKSIICNRPDGEGPDQPPFSAIELSAKAAGMEARYLPITPGQITTLDVETFGRLMQDLPKPVLAYCRTGTRASSLWEKLPAAATTINQRN